MSSMKKRWLIATAAVLATLAASMAFAQAATISGEVRRVDKEGGKVTLRHDGISELKLAAMTMVFRVSDPAMLDRMKAGEKVRVDVSKVDGQYTITALK
jgi:Cu/Ag efflux protein CusF